MENNIEKRECGSCRYFAPEVIDYAFESAYFTGVLDSTPTSEKVNRAESLLRSFATRLLESQQGEWREKLLDEIWNRQKSGMGIDRKFIDSLRVKKGETI